MGRPTPDSQPRAIEYLRLDEIQPAVRNPKGHNTAGIGRSIAHHGFGEAPLRDDRTGRLVAIRHTVSSLDRVSDIHEALGLLVKATDAYATQIDTLAAQTVTPAQFETFLTRWAPEASDSKMAKTMAENKRAELRTLYRTDERITPWTGTAFGVLQAVNTHRHHVKRVVGDTRYGRNMHDFIRGETARTDQAALRTLASVLA